MHFIIEFSNGIVQLSSVYNICAIKSMIVLEMKCPQLSKPEATAARNENSIGDRMEKKPWEKKKNRLKNIKSDSLKSFVQESDYTGFTECFFIH